MSKVVAILSGGMDSTAMVYLLLRRGLSVDCLTVDYGQRHRKEIDYARATAQRLGLRWDLLDLSGLGALLTGSALTDPSAPVPHGHYADETMRATIVPNRNAVMLSAAVAVAVARKADAVAFGAHAGDHPVYPDCRPEFVDAMRTVARVGNEGECAPGFDVVAPFLAMTKASIVASGHVLGVPWSETWSCYEGGEVHCGRCGTCVERREAFVLAGVTDPTVYAEE